MIPEDSRTRYIKKWLYAIAVTAFLINIASLIYIYAYYEPVTVSGSVFILTALVVLDAVFLAFALIIYSFLKKFF